MLLTKGYFLDLAAGALADGAAPNIRVVAVMSGVAVGVNAVHLADVTLDAFDGPGATEYDATGVTAYWDDTDEAWYLDADSGAGDEFGTAVAAGSDDITGYAVYRRVDGDPEHDVILGFVDEGGFPVQANGQPLALTLAGGHLLRHRNGS
jgi:hypothetical protein